MTIRWQRGWTLGVLAVVLGCASLGPVADKRLGSMQKLGLVSFSAPSNIPLPAGMGRETPRGDQPLFDAVTNMERGLTARDGLGQQVMEAAHADVVAALSTGLQMQVEPGTVMAKRPGYLELTGLRGTMEDQASPDPMMPLDTHPAALERLGPFAKANGLDGVVVIRVPKLALSTNGPQALQGSCRVQMWIVAADGALLYRDLGSEQVTVVPLDANQAVNAQVTGMFTRLIAAGVQQHVNNIARAAHGGGG